jgi:multicomponent K+:H+ antiporter subunit A
MLIVLYARLLFEPSTMRLGRFFCYLLIAFAGAMLGVVLSREHPSADAVFWELTSLTSFLLIGYRHHLPDSRISARMALAVTGGGGLALLAGLLLLGHIAGSFRAERRC